MPNKNVLQFMDACKVADWVVLVGKAGEEVDDDGLNVINFIKAQGLPSVLTCLQVHIPP